MTAYTSADEPKSGSLIVDGVRLHYLDWGGDGPPIVVLHATGFLGRVYRPIALALRAAGHVFSYDQRGHGDSGSAADGDYGWDRTKDDLEGFLTSMGLSGARGFGHSAGATAIGALASERPDLVSRAELVEPVIFTSPPSPTAGLSPLAERTPKRKRSFDSVEAMFKNFEHKPPYDTWRAEILRDYCEYGTRPTPDGRRELKCAPEVEAGIYRRSREFDGLSRILRCTVPLLVIFAEKSESEGVTLRGRLAAELKRGRVICLPGAHHLVPMERPEEIARMAVEFLGPE